MAKHGSKEENLESDQKKIWEREWGDMVPQETKRYLDDKVIGHSKAGENERQKKSSRKQQHKTKGGKLYCMKKTSYSMSTN